MSKVRTVRPFVTWKECSLRTMLRHAEVGIAKTQPPAGQRPMSPRGSVDVTLLKDGTYVASDAEIEREYETSVVNYTLSGPHFYIGRLETA